MKLLSQTKTKEEVIEWLTEVKKTLDKNLIYYVEQMHNVLGEYEIQAKERLKEISH